NNQSVVDNLIECGYAHNGFYIELDLSKQVRWSFVLEYKDYSLDQLFNNFKATTRNLIRKAIKHQVKIKELSYDELHIFKDVVDSTGERRHFECRPLSYYQSMYQHFHEDGYIKFLVATLNLNEYMMTIEEEMKDFLLKIEKLSDNPKSKGKHKEYQEALNGLMKKKKEAESLLVTHGSDLVLAGGMFMFYGDESIYLYSGSYQELMGFNGQYLIQWEVIQQSYQLGLKKHNFYGISGDFSKSNIRWGVYEFKRGFDGVVYEYIGDFDYVLKPIQYRLSQLNKKLRG
ncbi:MAG: peptidoglycan bridge formation glycyltransferase FemA/FemB family protein, partial [Erysipelotrichaceae bacterium]